jgi:hypothetical protein
MLKLYVGLFSFRHYGLPEVCGFKLSFVTDFPRYLAHLLINHIVDYNISFSTLLFFPSIIRKNLKV